MHRFILVAMLVAVCAGCGGGGGSGTIGASDIKKTVNLIGQGGPVKIYGIDMTIILPTGVTVSVNGSNELTPQALSLSGNAIGSSLVSHYVPASGNINGQVFISITNVNGFDVGPFGALNVSILTGYTVSENNVLQNITQFKAYDAIGSVLPSVSPVIVIN